MPAQQQQQHGPFAACVGIDWADREHALCLIAGGKIGHQDLIHSPEEIARWAEGLKKRFGEAPIAVALEQKRGALINALMQYDHLLLFPINPKQLACYRKALFPSGAKNDHNDAWLLARFLEDHHQDLRPFRPDAEENRRLARFCELRRTAVDSRKKLVQQLTAALKQYFPLVLQLHGTLHNKRALELLFRWPTHQQLRRVHPGTIRRVLKECGMRSDERQQEFIRQVREAMPLTTDRAVIEPSAQWVKVLVQQIRLLNKTVDEFEEQIEQQFKNHPDAELFQPLPGAGAALAPRLAVAFGSDRSRFADASEVSAAVGIAPVTRQSGNSLSVSKRMFCPKYLRQTFHEFADHSRRYSGWAKAYYALQKSRGKKHSAAVRALAFKWIRILFQVWKTRTPYDEGRYLEQLKKHNSPLIAFLEKAT